MQVATLHPNTTTPVILVNIYMPTALEHIPIEDPKFAEVEAMINFLLELRRDRGKARIFIEGIGMKYEIVRNVPLVA